MGLLFSKKHNIIMIKGNQVIKMRHIEINKIIVIVGNKKRMINKITIIMEATKIIK
jgi:hypothetical protein